MLNENNTKEQKLVQAVELSNAEMEKVSGGVDSPNYIGYEPRNGGFVGYGAYNGVEGSGGYETNNGGIVGFGNGNFGDSSSS